MSSTTDLLNSEIYPRIYENLPNALPEFGFKRSAKGYVSTTNAKITEETGDRVGGVNVYENAMFALKDWTRNSVSIWNYVKKRDGLTQQETMRRLAEIAGVTLATDSLGPEAMARVEAANRKAQIWEDANTFFIHCLSHKDNQFANTPGAKFVANYLINDRGYSPSLLLLPGQEQQRDQPKIEVGYVPSIKDLQLHLVHEIGYSPDEIQDLITDQRIGDTHRLSIPYRDPVGKIRGMVFRDVTGSSDAKYLYSAGLERRLILFNLKALIGDRDLVVVEGVLDALHASAAGMPNVVAIGGSGGSLSKEHIESAIKYGARRITLLLDNDRAGIEGTGKALKAIQQFPRLKPYVAYIDPEHKDLDKLLTTADGLAQANRVVASAIEGWRYQLNQLFDKYAAIEEATQEGLTDKDIANFLNEVVEAAGGLSQIEGEQFTKHFLDSEYIQGIGVTQETLNTIAKTIRSVREKEERSKQTKELLLESKARIDKGEVDEAVDLLQEKARLIKETHKADTFALLTQPVNKQEMIARLRQKSSDLKTGYIIEGEELEIPAGAVNILAAPTSHGKTTFMLNLGLRIIERQPKKAVYILSYEEDADSVLLSAMNIYIAADLSANNRKSIRSYYRDESSQYTRASAIPTFEAGEARFFSELINTHKLNIHYVNYDSDTLIEGIRFLHKYGNAGAVLIDYMQLLHKGQLGKNKYASRQLELQQICLDLKDVAVETGLPLILGAQFNREVVNPARLHSTKIREAADIEQIANLILGFWNNNMKMLAGEDEVDGLPRYHGSRDKIYIEKLKHRTGVPGLAELLAFDGNTGKIENSEPVSPSPFLSKSPKSSSII